MNSFESNRRTFIRQASVAGAGAFVAGSFPMISSRAAAPSENDTVLGHNGFTYRVNRDWGVLDSAKTPVLNCHEMVMDSKKRLIMITDEIKNNIIIYDRSGAFIDSWGTRWPGGHGLTLSQEGDEDFLFLVDCGWYLDPRTQKLDKQQGTVTKTTVDGKIVFSIGHPQTVGAYEVGQPFLPTEVAVAPNGDFYVADGYGSQYVLQYDRRGQFIRKFGGTENADPNHNLQNAHGVAVDLRDPKNPTVICTSRKENCFKVFTLDGKYLYTIEIPGAFVCRPVVHGENIYAGVCWSKEKGGQKRRMNTGFVTILDRDNKVVSNPGGSEPIYKDGKLEQLYQTSKVFNHGHDVCVDDDENLYVCQWRANKTYPIKLERV